MSDVARGTLLLVLTLTACGGGQGDHSASGNPTDDTIRQELVARLAQLRSGLDSLHLDSLAFEADSLDGVLTSLDTLSVAERKRTTDRVSAELDSLERVVATARFGELTDPDRFEQAAASALDGVATLLRHIDARVRNPDLTFPEGSREVWAELTGELAELHAESEIAVIMAPGRSLAASDSARLAFAHGLVALDQALHALAHDVGVPPDSIRPETTP